MSDSVFLAILFTVIGALVAADCARTIKMNHDAAEYIRKAYERCDAQGIPRVRCPL